MIGAARDISNINWMGYNRMRCMYELSSCAVFAFYNVEYVDCDTYASA